MKQRRPEWNYTEVLTLLGGERGVAAHIKAWGFDAPPSPTLKGWRHRNAIPGRWAPLIMMIAMREGIISDIRALAKTNSGDQNG